MTTYYVLRSRKYLQKFTFSIVNKKEDCAYKSGDDEDDCESFAEHSLGRYVSVADRRHGDEHKVEAVPERQLIFVVLVVVKRISVVLQLQQSISSVHCEHKGR